MVPGELVKVAAEAFMRPDVREHYRLHPDANAQAYYEERAREALAAAFAKLPECEVARADLLKALMDHSSALSICCVETAFTVLAKWGQP